MKIEEQAPAFVPLTVTFETADEFLNVLAALGKTSPIQREEFSRRARCVIDGGVGSRMYTTLVAFATERGLIRD